LRRTRVALWDLPNARVNLYRANGDYVSQFQAIGGWWGDNSFQVDTAGRFWVFTNITERRCIRTVKMPDGTEREVGSEAPGRNRAVYMRYNARGTALDTLRRCARSRWTTTDGSGSTDTWPP